MEDRHKKKMGFGQDGNSLMTLVSIIAIVFCFIEKYMGNIPAYREKSGGLR